MFPGKTIYSHSIWSQVLSDSYLLFVPRLYFNSTTSDLPPVHILAPQRGSEIQIELGGTNTTGFRCSKRDQQAYISAH